MSQLIGQYLTILLLEDMLLIGDDHDATTNIYLGSQTFIKQIEADDAVFAVTSYHPTMDARCIALECQTMTDAEGREAHHLHRLPGTRCIDRLDTAYLPEISDGRVVVDTGHSRTRIEFETITLTVYLDGQEQLVVIELDGNGIHEVSLHNGELQIIAVGLGIGSDAQEQQEDYGKCSDHTISAQR